MSNFTSFSFSEFKLTIEIHLIKLLFEASWHAVGRGTPLRTANLDLYIKR
jgi:hypothetical protein